MRPGRVRLSDYCLCFDWFVSAQVMTFAVRIRAREPLSEPSKTIRKREGTYEMELAAFADCIEHLGIVCKGNAPPACDPTHIHVLPRELLGEVLMLLFPNPNEALDHARQLRLFREFRKACSGPS